MIGTPAYMSPEQVRGLADLDARSDLYSLGVAAYEMVSGRLPFEAARPMDAMTQRLTQEPRPLRAVSPDVADDLVVAIQRCLQREPAKRWPDAKSLRFELMPNDESAEEDPLALRLIRLWSAMAGALGLVSFYVGLFALVNSSFRTSPIATILAPAIVLILLISGAAVTLVRHGVDLRTIVRGSLRQPRGWRFWYPRPLRRRGDVWDALPAWIRRVRFHFGLLPAFLLVIYVPLMIVLRLPQQPPAIRWIVQASPFVVIFLLVLERRRAVKRLAESLGVTSLQASKILSTPTWRTSLWQSGPAAALIRPKAIEPGAIRRGPPAAAPTTLPQSDDTQTLT